MRRPGISGNLALATTSAAVLVTGAIGALTISGSDRTREITLSTATTVAPVTFTPLPQPPHTTTSTSASTANRAPVTTTASAPTPPATTTTTTAPAMTTTTTTTAPSAPGVWSTLPPSPLSRRTATISGWTGKEFLIYGGVAGTADGCSTTQGCPAPTPAGGAYNPTTRTWRTLAAGPLDTNTGPVGAWDGIELLVVAEGGAAAYNPASNTWRSLPNEPATRSQAAVVWDGTELLVWGGADPQSGVTNTGDALDPVKGTWRQISGAPMARANAAAVWTGADMLVWGGYDESRSAIVPHADGVSYDPNADTWTVIPAGPLTARYQPATVWTGQTMFVWGGSASAGSEDADGATYSPATHQWAKLPASPLSARSGPPAVWTGSSVMLWSAGPAFPFGSPAANDGASYNPATNQWKAMGVTPLAPRSGSAVTWTGTQLIAWGGGQCTGSACSSDADGAAYTPTP